MTTLIIEDELAAQLHEIAADENRPVTAVLRSLLELYTALPKHSVPSTTSMLSTEALEMMDGMFDNDVTDLSTTTWRDILN